MLSFNIVSFVAEEKLIQSTNANQFSQDNHVPSQAHDVHFAGNFLFKHQAFNIASSARLTCDMLQVTTMHDRTPVHGACSPLSPLLRAMPHESSMGWEDSS